MKRNARVLVGMSGGVDSSVAAAMLIEQGYEVHGIFVEAYNEPGCRTDQDKKDALQVALKLGVPFKVLDLRREYKERVVNYFIDEYKLGRTPNPDIICNRDIKFGLLYDYMVAEGYDYLATGHYGRVSSWQIAHSGWQYRLQRPIDLSKDQTYFLWQVEREKLGKILWPLGTVKKSWVRQRASELGLPNADKPDSMGVCMMGELNVASFLKEKLGIKPGKVMWKEQVIGTHEGLWLYTIGSRGGWQSEPSTQSATMPALYVVGKDIENNILRVGQRDDCYSSKFIVNGTWHIDEECETRFVRIRNLGELCVVKSLKVKGKSMEIKTDQAVFAVAPGQSAVLYNSEGMVVGGGIIAKQENSVY